MVYWKKLLAMCQIVKLVRRNTDSRLVGAFCSILGRILEEFFDRLLYSHINRLFDSSLEGLFNGVLENDDIFYGELDGLSYSIWDRLSVINH